MRVRDGRMPSAAELAEALRHVGPAHVALDSVDGSIGFDEAGVGTSAIAYTLDADASATYACINGGGNHPKAANKETLNAELTGGATYEPKHGRVSGSIS